MRCPVPAQLDPLQALPVLRVPGTGREPELNERQVDARRRVHETLQALGGISSPAGSCVWHVVGLQRSVREWAIRQGWNGRPIDQRQAQGILIAALGTLTPRSDTARRGGCRDGRNRRAPDLRRLPGFKPIAEGLKDRALIDKAIQLNSQTDSTLRHGGDDRIPVVGDNFLFIAVVEIDVELRDAGVLQRFQLGDVILRLTQDSKAVDDIVRDEVEIGVIALAMLGIVVAPAFFDVRDQA